MVFNRNGHSLRRAILHGWIWQKKGASRCIFLGSFLQIPSISTGMVAIHSRHIAKGRPKVGKYIFFK